MKQFLEAGEFVTTHGIAGELRLYPWSDDLDFLAGFTRFYLDAEGKKQVELEAVRPHKNICIVKLAGIHSINDARVYIGKTVYINRSDVQLAPGRYFVQDLLGLAVKDADTGRQYGVIAGVTRPGRHDVYEIQAPGGESALFPATPPFLVSTSLEDKTVLVRPIPGMFDDGAIERPEDGEAQ